ncbi:MAG TPA: histidine ammonia-lyase [Chloroflexota bacterium]|nr:histidine ammonia-lyase [Chloroflexota bacterium]
MQEPHAAPSGPIVLDGAPLAIEDVVAVAREGRATLLAEEARRAILRGRQVIESIVEHGDTVYGVNTGFGSLARVRVSPAQLLELQRNLVRSHAAGVGDALPVEIARAMLLITAASLARGYSGVRPALVDGLLALLNAGVHPLIPWQGSLGASGDLAPLAHMALVLIGEGEALYQGERLPGDQALARAGLAPLTLRAKEGLALINGTHLMSAVGALCVADAEYLLKVAEATAAMSVDALRGTDTAFDARIHQARAHPGQSATAATLRDWLAGSEIRASHAGCARVQDPYTLRCIPQVLGAVREAVAHARAVLGRELGAVTDNPLCFADAGEVLSGGNFHGQPIALPLDYLAIALTTLGGFSERRTYALVSTWEGEAALPVYLTPDPGLRSGVMIAQYVAASLVAENKILAHPASVDSIPTSAGIEDYVSMGATAAWKARRVLENTTRAIAIELLCAAQAIESRRPLRSSPRIEALVSEVRVLVHHLDADRSLAPDIEAIAAAIRSGKFVLA